VLLVLAGLTAVVAVPTWFTTTGTTALEGTVAVHVSGSQVAPAILAAAVAVLAAVAAVALVGRAGRWVVALVVVACGVLVVRGVAGDVDYQGLVVGLGDVQGRDRGAGRTDGGGQFAGGGEARGRLHAQGDRISGAGIRH